MADAKNPPPPGDDDVPILVDAAPPEDEAQPASSASEAAAEPQEEAARPAEAGEGELEEVEAAELVEDEPQVLTPPVPSAAPPPFQAPPPPLDGAESALAAALKRAQRPDPLAAIDLYAKELEDEPEPARQGLLHHEMGELREYRLHDEPAAAKAYAKALQSDPTYRPNLWAIRRVFYRRGLWPNLLKLIGAELKYAARQPDEEARLQVERGHLLEDRLGDLGAAIEAYEAAVAASPRHLPALIALERACIKVKNLPGRQRALRALTGATTEPARKVALLAELAALEESPEAALQVLSEAYEVGVERARVLDSMERVAEKNGRTQEIWTVLERKLELVPPDRPAEAAALLRQQALIARGELGDPARSADCYARALELLPGNRLLLLEATEAAEAAGRPADAAAYYGERLKDAEPAQRPALAFARALMLAQAGRDAEAEQALAELEAERPDYFALHLALERRQLAASDWSRLSQLYISEAERAKAGWEGLRADPEWAASAYVMAGEICERRLSDGAQAVRLYREALALVPGYRGAVDALESVLVRTGQLSELGALFCEEQARGGHEPERADYLDETLARLYRGPLGDSDLAFAALQRLVERHPDDPRARRRLAHAAAEAGLWPEVARELALLAQLCEGDERLALNIECADVLAERVGDGERAAELYREVLEAQPGHPVAAAALEAVLRRERRWEDLIALLRDEAQADAEGGPAALYKIAEIHERELGQPTQAAAVYRQILEASSTDGAALRSLARVLAASGDATGLAGALADEAQVLPPGRARAEGLLRVGEVLEDGLGDDAQAEHAYARAVDEDSALYDAYLGLARVQARRRDWQQLAATYSELAAGADEETHRLYRGEVAWLRGETSATDDLHARTARYLLAARGGAAAEAAGALAESVRDDRMAAALHTSAGLSEIAAGADPRPSLRAALLRAADAPDTVWLMAQLQDGDPHERATVLEKAARLCEGDVRAALMLECAEALEQAGRPAEAAQALEDVLLHDPTHVTALATLRRLARAANDKEGLWRACAHLGAALESTLPAATAFAEAAAVLDRDLGRPVEAAPLYRQVLERMPADDDAYARLHDILSEAGKSRELAELLGHKLANTDEPGARVPLYAERADLRLRALEDRKGAARDLRALLELDPDHLESLRRLGELYAEDGHASQAVHFLERFLAEADSVPGLLHAIHLKVAELSERQLHDPRRAIAHLRHAAELAPEDPVAHAELSALYLRARDYPHAIDAYRKLGQAKGDPKTRAHCEVRAGQIYRDGVRDLAAARRAFESAIDLEPLCLDAVGDLQALLARVGDEAARRVLLQKTLSAVRAALVANPLQPEIIQALCNVAEWAGAAESRYQAAELAVFFNVARPADEEFFVQRRTGRTAEPSRSLSPEARERLWAADIDGPWRRAWALLAEAVHRVAGPEPARFGVGRGDRVTERPGGTWTFVFRLAQALGVRLTEIYVTQAHTDVCVPAGVDPGVLIVGSGLSGMPAPRARYRLGKALAYLAHHAAPLASASEEEARLLLAAGAQLAGLRPPRALAGSALEEHMRRLDRTLGRKERKQLAQLVPQLQEAGDPGGFVRALAASAARTGLLFAGDLAAALEEARPGLPPAGTRRFKSAADLVTDLDGHTEAIEVLRLASSDDLLALRRELGWM